MASQDLERLIGRAVVDADFRKMVEEDLDGASKEAGLELSDEEKRQLQSAIDSGSFQELKDFADALDQRTSRGCMGENK